MLGNLRFRARLLPLIDYDHARHRNYWLFITLIPKALPATDTQVQQGFIDERAPLNPTTVDAKRTEFQTDETAKELRALLHN